MESRPCLKPGYVGQGSRSLGQIVENNIVHITTKISFTPKFIALRSRLESFEILKLKLYVKFLRAITAKPDDGSGSYLAW